SGRQLNPRSLDLSSLASLVRTALGMTNCGSSQTGLRAHVGLSSREWAPLKMEFQASSDRARRCVLDRNLFALFCDFVAVVGNVGDVELQVKPAWLSIPQIYTGCEVGGQMLWQPGSALYHRPAAVP